MTGVDLAALRALAEKATPGPWRALSERVGHYEGGAFFTIAQVQTWEGHEPDAAFIAALDPATVLALVEAVEAALVVDAVTMGARWVEGAAELQSALAPFRQEPDGRP